MNEKQYRDAIDRLGLSQVQAGTFLDVSTRTSHGWANGQNIPRSTAMLLAVMLSYEISPAVALDKLKRRHWD